MPLPPHISDCSDTKNWLQNNSLHKMGGIVLFLKVLLTFGEHQFICYTQGGGSLSIESSNSCNHSGVSIIKNVNSGC